MSIIGYFISFTCICVPIVVEGSHYQWNDGEIVNHESLRWSTGEATYNTLNSGFDNWTVNVNGRIGQSTEWGTGSISVGNNGDYIDVTHDTGTLLEGSLLGDDFIIVLIAFTVVFLLFTLCRCSSEWRHFRHKKQSHKRLRFCR